MVLTLFYFTFSHVSASDNYPLLLKLLLFDLTVFPHFFLLSLLRLLDIICFHIASSFSNFPVITNNRCSISYGTWLCYKFPIFHQTHVHSNSCRLTFLYISFAAHTSALRSYIVRFFISFFFNSGNCYTSFAFTLQVSCQNFVTLHMENHCASNTYIFIT